MVADLELMTPDHVVPIQIIVKMMTYSNDMFILQQILLFKNITLTHKLDGFQIQDCFFLQCEVYSLICL